MSKQMIVVAFGAGAVGKSAMTIRYINGKFIPDYDPTIEDAYMASVTVEGTTYSVEFLDTAGEEDFLSMRLPYIRRSDAFMLIYSIDNRQSFDEIEGIYYDIMRNKGKQDLPIMLCGNKCDLEDRRVVTKSEGEVLAHQLNCKFFETSAKTNINIKEAFEGAVKEIVARMPKKEEKHVQEEKRKSFWDGMCTLI